MKSNLFGTFICIIFLFFPRYVLASIELNDFYVWTNSSICNDTDKCQWRSYRKLVKLLSSDLKSHTYRLNIRYNTIMLCEVEVVDVGNKVHKEAVGSKGLMYCAHNQVGDFKYTDFTRPVIRNYDNNLAVIQSTAAENMDLTILNKLVKDFSHHQVALKAQQSVLDVNLKIDKQKQQAKFERTQASTFEMKAALVDKILAESFVEQPGIKYSDAFSEKETDKLISEIFKAVENINSIAKYRWFIDKYGAFPQTDNARKNIFNLVKQENNIAGYHWFISQYPNVPQAKLALMNMHDLAFKLVLDIDTLEAYNDFIIAYPTARQVKQATAKAYDLEESEYTGFFSDEEKEARRLLIQSKILEQTSSDLSRKKRMGYLLIVDRMNDLLKQEFDSTDAALRHLESNEFKKFVTTFKYAMRDLEEQVKRIADNTDDLSSIMKNQSETMRDHFEKAALDREMASELTKQHRHWERYIGKVGK